MNNKLPETHTETPMPATKKPGTASIIDVEKTPTPMDLANNLREALIAQNKDDLVSVRIFIDSRGVKIDYKLACPGETNEVGYPLRNIAGDPVGSNKHKSD